jgi:hypothetical protein
VRRFSTVCTSDGSALARRRPVRRTLNVSLAPPRLGRGDLAGASRFA